MCKPIECDRCWVTSISSPGISSPRNWQTAQLAGVPNCLPRGFLVHELAYDRDSEIEVGAILRRSSCSIAGRGSGLVRGSRRAAVVMLLFLLTFQMAVANHKLFGGQAGAVEDDGREQ